MSMNKEDLIMKNYTITVNGNTYEVSVEEGHAAPARAMAAPVAAPAPVAQAAPVAAPAPQAEAPKPTKAASAAGSVKVPSPMPGKIISVKVSEGKAIKRGEVILVLEAMKMENEIVAPQDGTVASINVAAGQSVEAGELLATLN